jgi:hypothetical protein
MSKADLHRGLNNAYEITLSVKGRKSGKNIPRPVWFVYEGSTLYLLPVQGSDTSWYKNLLVDPTLKISVNGIEISARGKPITDSNRVDDSMRKFKFKYGDVDVERYYTKFDVARLHRKASVRRG